ncbi:hypothetical protein [Alicyclobacillus acidiphilus]|uniref:hypothetical protein n=1 Tax=Alicyclobacillus acidiphilus TaxID=182455 RepID=UPI0008374CCC|nr:hypothetical protein [Alicyclobacillus acidiphilus]
MVGQDTHIEVSGSVVICGCGHGIGEDAGSGILREFDVPDTEGDDPLDPAIEVARKRNNILL